MKMKKQMKKYFMQGTADELKFGDMILLDLTEEMPNGKVKHHHVECKFIPEAVPMLLEEGIIEVQDVKGKEVKEEKEDTPSFADCPMVDELVKANQNLERRVYSLEKLLMQFDKVINSLAAVVLGEDKPRRNAKKQGRK